VFIEIESSDCVRQLRCEPRMKVLLSGQLHSRRGVSGCRVHDISRGGAALDADRAHDVGEAVAFHRGDFKVGGTVAWSRGKSFGISFDEPIRATEIFVQMSRSREERAGSPTGVSACANAPFPSR
jgi:hypothetical protein